MSRTHKGFFNPQNPDKYVGKKSPIYRSSWELQFMRMCDAHPSIIAWDSEPIRIPYQNPLTRKNTVYVPDFLIVYQDAQGHRRSEVVEIKPKKETFVSEAKTKRSQLALAVNAMKWKAAQAYCNKHGLTFRVINEDHIFRNPGTRRKSK